MPTENRRVAAYLPKSIDDQLEAFKSERGLKGDSPALIAILEEYFGVSREVTHLSSSEVGHLSQKIEVIDRRLDQLKNDVFDELPGELNKLLFFWKTEVKNELLSELKSELLEAAKADQPREDSELHGESQSELTTTIERELQSESKSELLPMAEADLAIRFKLTNPRSIGNKRLKTKNTPEEFAQWSMGKDPDKKAWLYNPDTKLYYPVNQRLSSESEDF